MWLFQVYVIGCVVYGVFIFIMGLLDKEVPQETVEKAMWMIPLWPIILYLTIKNLWRMKK